METTNSRLFPANGNGSYFFLLGLQMINSTNAFTAEVPIYGKRITYGRVTKLQVSLSFQLPFSLKTGTKTEIARI
jgi:hypothetical protein